MFNSDYGKKLNDIRWKSKCIEIKKRDKGKCKICGSTKYLNVHHRQYHFVTSLNQFKNPWDYPQDILVTLCNDCHLIGHKLYKIPIINI
jgi:5-methylcytosine-specific restriction endonuclease McrA